MVVTHRFDSVQDRVPEWSEYQRVDGFEEITTHYSPSAWAWVTHKVKQHGVRRPHTGASQR